MKLHIFQNQRNDLLESLVKLQYFNGSKLQKSFAFRFKELWHRLLNMSIINDLVNNTDECTKAWQLLLIRDQVLHKSLVDLIWKAIICSCIHERFDFDVCTVGNLNRAYQRRFSYDSQHLELFVTFPATATLFLRKYLYVKNMALYYIDLNKTTVRTRRRCTMGKVRTR